MKGISTLTLHHLLVFCSLLICSAEQKPNFIIIFTDDQGYQDVGCYGSPHIKTPNLDQMAREGMKFTSFYAQTVCGPSRLALMTGSYPMRTERAAHDRGLVPHPAVSLNEIFIPELLQPLGYQTAAFGKWDLAGRAGLKTFSIDLSPQNQGFDYSLWAPTSNDKPVDLYENQELVDTKVAHATLTQRYTDATLDYISEYKESPFFIYLAHSMPHTVLGASKEFKGKSDEGLYGDVIEELDHNVGRILTHLKKLGLDENTYVIFTSDNGPWWIRKDHGGHCAPLRGAKTSTYEGGLRVPCIIRAPGKVPAGTTCNLVTSTLDLLPTIASLSGAAVPSDRVIDGLDISDIIHGEQDLLDRIFYYYQHQSLRAVRKGPWKLHLPHSELDKSSKEVRTWTKHIPVEDRPLINELTLYNLEQDIAETTNVAKEHPEIVAELVALLDFAKQDIGYHGVIGKNSRRNPIEAYNQHQKSQKKEQK